MRFHLDEHVAHAVAEGLRRRGIDVTTTGDAQLLDAPDVDHIAFALREQRVIVTMDRDFVALHAAGAQHEGIVYVAQGIRSTGELVRFLTLLHDCLDSYAMRRRVEYA